MNRLFLCVLFALAVPLSAQAQQRIPPSIVLVDGNGVEIAPIIDFDYDKVRIVLEVSDSLGATLYVGALVDKDRFESGNLQPKFLNDDTCSGQAYFEAFSFSTSNPINFPTFARAWIADTSMGTSLYTATTDTPEPIVGNIYELGPSGCVFLNSLPAELVLRAELIDPDLHATYPLPYSIEQGK